MDDSSLPTQQPERESRKRPEPIGPLLAPIIIVLLLALGALYVFVEHQQQAREAQEQAQGSF
jgi:uncharacterized protein HemX